MTDELLALWAMVVTLILIAWLAPVLFPEKVVAYVRTICGIGQVLLAVIFVFILGLIEIGVSL